MKNFWFDLKQICICLWSYLHPNRSYHTCGFVGLPWLNKIWCYDNRSRFTSYIKIVLDGRSCCWDVIHIGLLRSEIRLATMYKGQKPDSDISMTRNSDTCSLPFFRFIQRVNLKLWRHWLNLLETIFNGYWYTDTNDADSLYASDNGFLPGGTK